jgi:hypothetical protein
VLDEAVQLVRHLLTSATCARDGKRPALLARFRALVQHAKRVIVADADLDNATLHYLRSLRGERTVFLVRNDFEPEPYACRWLAAPDRTAVTGALLSELAALPSGPGVVCGDGQQGAEQSLTPPDHATAARAARVAVE